MTADRAPATRRLSLLTAAAVALALAVAAWPGDSDAPAAARDHAVASAAHAVASDHVASPSGSAEVPADLQPLSDFADAPRPLLVADAPALAAKNPEKALAKLAKKKAKQEAKLAKTEAKIDDAEATLDGLADELALAQDALADALDLPADTPEQIKARDKAIKAAQKAIAKLEKKTAKFEKKVGKLDDKVAQVEEQIDAIVAQIDELEDGLPGTLPEAGEPGLAGLDLPDRMQVITVDAHDAVASPSLGASPDPGAEPTDGFPPEADYFADEQHAFIHDRSMESLEQVNAILCQLSQSGYDQLVNVGPYNAQIDRSLCDAGQQDDGGNGGQSGDESEALDTWVVDSRRSTPDDDHFVGLWVNEDGGHDDGGDQGGDQGTGDGGPGDEQFEEGTSIRVLIHITEEESEDNPFGVFDLDFAAVPPGGTEDDLYFWGTLATADATEDHMGFTFFQEQGDPGDANSWFGRTQVHVNMFTDGTQGVARVKDQYYEPFGGGPGGQPFEEDIEYLLAFDQEHLLRQEVGGPQLCLSRTEFDTSVWRYNLYHAGGEQAGQRVKLNSGFGFTTADGDFGWAGYHGLGYPDGVTLDTGDIVYGNTYGPPGGDPPPEYEVYIAPGRLIESRRSQLATAELDGETFEWWAFGIQPGVQPGLYLLQYDDASADFVAIQVQQGPGWQALDPLDQFAVDRQYHTWLNLWSPSLGGSVEHLAGDDFVTYFEERLVDGQHPLLAEGDVQLYGLIDCLDAGILGSEAESGDVYLPDAMQVGDAYVYSFSALELGLELLTPGVGTGSLPVGLADGESYSSGPYNWGMRSGPMVTSLDGLSSPFDLFHAEVTYSYETGPNHWNRYETLRDELGDLVSFDPPIQFTYVHSLANDRNGDGTFAGKTYQLEYNGPGDLWGIPHDGFDTDGDGQQDRWYPRFSLADGVLLGPEGDEYVVKALEMEQRLAEHPQGCNALTTDPVASLPLPDGGGFSFPDIGDKPVVTDPPLVVAGELQGGD